MSENPRIRQLGDELVARAENDSAFRRLLADDLEGTVRQAAEQWLASADPSELSDQELEAVTGGAGAEGSAQSTKEGSESGSANDQMQQMLEIIRSVRDKLSDINQSQTETNRGISRNS